MGVHFDTSFRNPLAYPAGYMPGFDPSHACAPLTRFSGVAVNGNFVNLLTGVPGTLTGSPTAKINSPIGLATSYPTSTAKSAWSGQSTINDAQCTFGAIVYAIVNFGTHYGIFHSSSANSGLRFRLGNNTTLVVTAGGISDHDSGLSINDNGFYFFGCSADVNGANFLIKNLRTGAVRTATIASFASTAAPNGTYVVGNNNFNQPYSEALAAVMFSVHKCSLAELLQWAADPWSFWYPNPGDNWIAAQAAGFPWWAVKNNHMILGAN